MEGAGGGVGITMSWVENIEKLTIVGGDDYSGLESNHTLKTNIPFALKYALPGLPNFQ